MPAPDPVELTRALIRCPSVTPEDAGALGVVADALEPLGFVCERLRFEAPGTAPVDNLFARLGTDRPNLAFAGHTDVVPPGDPSQWRFDPLAGEIAEGALFGRGAVDMKSGIACFIAACGRYLDRRGLPPGSISLLITGDEEGPAVNGTAKLLEWAEARGHALDGCLVGEPTSPDKLGQLIKIGRRGSLTGYLRVIGRQGHVAYPDRAENAAHRITGMLGALIAERMDEGTHHFEPSNLEITTIDVGNPASNVVPGEARAAFNIRYNDAWTPESLEAWLKERLDRAGGRYELVLEPGAQVFLSEPGPLCRTLEEAVHEVTGIRPGLGTSGGTSDARFIQRTCPVVEFGLVGQTMHATDEHVALVDLEGLTRVYERFLERYFESA